MAQTTTKSTITACPHPELCKVKTHRSDAARAECRKRGRGLNEPLKTPESVATQPQTMLPDVYDHPQWEGSAARGRLLHMMDSGVVCITDGHDEAAGDAMDDEGDGYEATTSDIHDVYEADHHYDAPAFVRNVIARGDVQAWVNSTGDMWAMYAPGLSRATPSVRAKRQGYDDLSGPIFRIAEDLATMPRTYRRTQGCSCKDGQRQGHHTGEASRVRRSHHTAAGRTRRL